MYEFKELCDNVMSDYDFRAICRNHKAMIVKNIPKVETKERNIANRFIKLVMPVMMQLDEVYVNNMQFICSAEAPL
jgi:predicted ATPase